MLPGETVLSGYDGRTVDDFEVMLSAAGYYIGTFDDDGCPCTRETGYFPSQATAEEALRAFRATGELFKQRGTATENCSVEGHDDALNAKTCGDQDEGRISRYRR